MLYTSKVGRKHSSTLLSHEKSVIEVRFKRLHYILTKQMIYPTYFFFQINYRDIQACLTCSKLKKSASLNFFSHDDIIARLTK